jgi:mannan endo-1,4-beta-mannosidase
VAIGVAAIVVVPRFTAARPNPFVTRSGSTLLVNRHVLRFSGANIFWGALDTDARTGLNYPTPFRVQSALRTVADMGETVIRCQTCGISTGTPLSVEPTLGGFSQTALRHIDYFVAQAQAYGMKLIIPFTDNYAYYLGSYCDFTNWLHLSTPQNCPSAAAVSAFYTNPKAIAAFERYIELYLNHVNYYTGVRNKDNPAFMAWETGNELPFGRGGAAEFTKWTARIAAYIRSQDAHHLIMDGAVHPGIADLKLRDVDIVDQHYYQAGSSALNGDAALASSVHKVLVVGEYGWNSMAGLASFLSDIQRRPAVAGDAYWSLEPQNDFFGYVEHFDGYQLHFPGDNADVFDYGGGEPVLAHVTAESQVTDLRNHAYAMSGERAPGYPAPPAPGMTNVEHVVSSTAGTGNLLEWRGSPGAASYQVLRSTTGAAGPWTRVATVGAGDTAAPWLDRGAGAGPKLWYQVTALNPTGIPGPPSTPFQVVDKTFDDNLSTFAAMLTHTPGVSLSTSVPWQYGDDASRLAFPADGASQQASWGVPGPIQTFETIAYYSVKDAMRLTFQVSSDNTAWTAVPASNVQANQIAGTNTADQIAYVYTADNTQRVLKGARYFRIVRQGGHGMAEIGEVRLTYLP